MSKAALKRHLKALLEAVGLRQPSVVDPEDADLDIASTAGTFPPVWSGLGLEADATPVKQYPWWQKPERVLVADASPRRLAWLQEAAPGVQLITAFSFEEAEHIEADVVIGWCNHAMVVNNDRLRWVQLNTIGVEMHPSRNAELASRGILVSNLKGITSPLVAEHAVAMLLSLARKLPQYYLMQQKRLWNPRACDLREMPSLWGKTALIVGMGSVGMRVAEILRAHGMRVIGIRHKVAAKPDWIEKVGNLDDLPALAEDADLIVNTLPQTPATINVFDEKVFSRTRSSAIFINVGRGASVVTEALTAALREGRLAGAGLDVMEPEPLPKGHPLWRMKNVLITPHVASRSIEAKRWEWAMIKENLRRYVEGEPILSVINPAQGY